MWNLYDITAMWNLNDVTHKMVRKIIMILLKLCVCVCVCGGGLGWGGGRDFRVQRLQNGCFS